MVKKISLRFCCLFICLMAASALLSLSISATANTHTDSTYTAQREENDGFSSLRLLPGGDIFGVRLHMDGVLVSSMGNILCDSGECCPAKDGGLKCGDLITEMNGSPVKTAQDVIAVIENAGTSPITVTVLRGDRKSSCTVTPVKTKDGAYRIGIFIRDRAAGIGTVTFIDPKTGAFGGLGHGICDPETGIVVKSRGGHVTDVSLHGVTKGKSGEPGELRGTLGMKKMGVLRANTKVGVFGMMKDCQAYGDRKALPLARAKDVKTGAARIYCTLPSGERKSYKIDITKIAGEGRETKCFTIRVTDPALIRETGGIVQGLSGSPIIQNGKLVGAVTHVMVNDPTEGYGIFIENMLRQMKQVAD